MNLRLSVYGFISIKHYTMLWLYNMTSTELHLNKIMFTHVSFQELVWGRVGRSSSPRIVSRNILFIHKTRTTCKLNRWTVNRNIIILKVGQDGYCWDVCSLRSNWVILIDCYIWIFNMIWLLYIYIYIYIYEKKILSRWACLSTFY